MSVRIQQLVPGMVQHIQTTCQECMGEGERINPKDRCKTCNAKKVVRERKILEVHIDKGAFPLFLCGASMLSKMRLRWPGVRLRFLPGLQAPSAGIATSDDVACRLRQHLSLFGDGQDGTLNTAVEDSFRRRSCSRS